LHRRRGRWKMDPTLMADEHLQRKMHTKWVKWQNLKCYYPNMTSGGSVMSRSTFKSLSARNNRTVTPTISKWKITDISASMIYYIVTPQRLPKPRLFNVIKLKFCDYVLCEWRKPC
jgi:hypothetical protein